MITIFSKAVLSLGVGSLLTIGLIVNEPKLNTDTAQYQNEEIKNTEINEPLEKWIFALGNCESGNKDNALNPSDLDSTPSYGRFQFKIGTFRHFVKKYNLFNWQEWEEADWWNNLWNGQTQEEVLRKMINDPEVNLKHQFPACVRLLGLPPNEK